MHHKGHNGVVLFGNVSHGIGLAGLQRERLQLSRKLKVTWPVLTAQFGAKWQITAGLVRSRARRMCVYVCLGAAADRWRLPETSWVLTPLYRRVPLFSPCLLFTRTHMHSQNWSPHESTALCLLRLQDKDIKTYTLLISDIQAVLPFKAKATGADETKMDMAAVMLHSRLFISIHSPSPPRQLHSLTLALCINLIQKLIKSSKDKCTQSWVSWNNVRT